MLSPEEQYDQVADMVIKLDELNDEDFTFINSIRDYEVEGRFLSSYQAGKLQRIHDKYS